MVTWKIVGISEVSVIYIYIYRLGLMTKDVKSMEDHL